MQGVTAEQDKWLTFPHMSSAHHSAGFLLDALRHRGNCPHKWLLRWPSVVAFHTIPWSLGPMVRALQWGLEAQGAVAHLQCSLREGMAEKQQARQHQGWIHAAHSV